MGVWDPTFMILPSLSCQAACRYCFGPHEGAMMDLRTARETVRFVRRTAEECGMTTLRVIFHGGEPLLAPMEVWETLLKGLSDREGGLRARLSVQSNLWALDEKHVALFKRYGVRLGTSLDGPRELCDLNRGAGYFEKTTAAMERAEAAGMRVGVIATLTKQTLPHAREVLRYFRDRGLTPVLHGAIRGLDAASDDFALSPEEYAEGILSLYPWYVENRKAIRVPTLDHFCAAAVHGESAVCTMSDCLGQFLVVTPTGDVTFCQRFAGRPEYVLGNIFDFPTAEELFTAPAAQRLREREAEVSARCGDCRWLNVCRGGCWYNAVSGGDGVIDPLCGAYKKIYGFLEDRLDEEAVSPENLAALRSRPARPGEHPLLKSGPYISLADEVHPSVLAENARAALAAHALAKTGDAQLAAESLVAQKVCGDLPQTAAALRQMQAALDRSGEKLNNCYFHVTLRCNLRCTHCYASAGETDSEMELTVLERLAEEAIGLRFRQLIITGGEPLFHREREALLALCARLRGRGANVVLRTNLTGNFTDEELRAVARAFDQVVVSVDGSEETHDRRRGAGTYRSVTENCARYAAIERETSGAGELSLACVMDAASINGEPGDAVRALGERLGVRRLRFRPLLPLGRAADMDEPIICEGVSAHEAPLDKLRSPFRPLVTCGVGQNLYLRPDGEAYPCYAWQTAASRLGNAADEGLAAVLAGEAFTRLRRCTVDTIEKCRDCEYRYLCGGACRAWGNQNATDPNAAPPDCAPLRQRAEALLTAAREYLLN